MAFEMIRARLTLKDGRTPGALRTGAALINACIARGCRIVKGDPQNKLPKGVYDAWIVDLEKVNTDKNPAS